MQRINLDHNATTPLAPEAAAAMRDCLSAGCANPASQHADGRQARKALESARRSIADLLGIDLSGSRRDRLLFTSGGTEANNLALLGLGAAKAGRLAPIVVSAIEHPSVVGPAEHLATCGVEVGCLPVDVHGVVEVDRLAGLLTPQTRLASVMLANNETGVLQPVKRLAAVAAAAGVPLHTDAVQVAGKLPLDFSALGVAAMTLSAHKFHGPVGIGALVIRGDVELAPLHFGGFQQESLRPGTEPVALAVGMAAALEAWSRDAATSIARMTTLRNRFENAIVERWPTALVLGAGVERLPHTSNLAFPGLDRQALFMALDLAGVSCSTGSACSSGSTEASAALVAMGLADDVVASALRFSLGRFTQAVDVDEAARRILSVCNELRARSPGRKIPAARRE